jgi:uncharacterized protein (TIGR02118 family)
MRCRACRRTHQKEFAVIKFNVMYPRAEGARFDHAYYRDKHMPMIKERLGAACLYYTVDKGLAGGAPGAPSPYLAACSIVFESLEAMQQALGPHAKAIQADIANYTDAQPVIWISEVVVEHS